MLRVSHLRKLVKPSTPCPESPIALTGTEVGAPVSPGFTVEVLEGTVTATGAGYDFIDGVLWVSTKEGCPLTSEMTFSIAGTGPVPALTVLTPDSTYWLIGVLDLDSPRIGRFTEQDQVGIEALAAIFLRLSDC